MSDKKMVIEVRAIQDLTPHPRNNLIPELSEANLAALAADIKSRRLQHPIDILPNGTILGGHQRVRAAKLLGMDKIRCRVRYDLEAEGEYAIECFLICDNLHRRQMNMLEVAQQFKNLVDLDKKHGKRSIIQIRDVLAKQFELSGRTLERWKRLLDAPLVVQQAVLQRKLKLVQGCAVASASREIQKAFAARLVAGEDPGKIMEDLFPADHQVKADAAWRVLDRLMNDLMEHDYDLGARIKELESEDLKGSLQQLKRGLKFLSSVITQIESIPGSSA